MKHLYAEFTALPESVHRVAELVAGYAHEVRSEAGCLAFDPFVRTDEERRWIVFEAYTDESAFSAHLATDHNRRFNAEITSHIEGGASSLVWLTAASTER